MRVTFLWSGVHRYHECRNVAYTVLCSEGLPSWSASARRAKKCGDDMPHGAFEQREVLSADTVTSRQRGSGRGSPVAYTHSEIQVAVVQADVHRW